MSTTHEPPATETDPLVSEPSTIATRLPLQERLYIGACLWGFKLFVNNALRLLRLSNYLTSKNQPDRVTYYPERPNLEVRIFFPPGHSSKAEGRNKLPTYLNIHGGGFALCDPIVDDDFCDTLARKYGFLVVSMAYSLAPLHPFPTPVHDIRALITAILSDSTLPIDASRVFLGGFSAGGNLSLAAAQDPTISSKLRGIIPIYPVVDFSGKYKGQIKDSPDGQKDMLARSGAWFTWGYINPGQDKTDPLLSTIYADRATLPQKMFFIGAEFDVLCWEAWCMARLLAGDKVDGKATGKEMIEEEWQQGGIKWKMVRGQRHGFTHAKEGDAGKEKKRLEVTDELWAEMADWLREASR